MSDVFISYARPDQELARALAHDLESRGFAVWWDIELVGSDDFTDAIQAALSVAKCTVMVRDEARLALDQGKLNRYGFGRHVTLGCLRGTCGPPGPTLT